MTAQAGLEAPRPGADVPVRRVWIDCTRSYFRGGNTGIQRVVRNVVRESVAAGSRRGVECQPIVWAGFDAVRPRRALRVRPHWVSLLRDGVLAAVGHAGFLVKRWTPRWLQGWLFAKGRGRLTRLRAWLGTLARPILHRVAGIAAFPREFLGGARIDLGPGDLLLLLDSGWGIAGMERLIRRARARGARIGLVLHDLIPIEQPEVCSFSTRSFATWLEMGLESADFVVSVSDATRTRLLQHMREQGRPASGLPTGVFRLGAELDLAAGQTATRPALTRALGGSASLYLAVGTLEPRKNHGLLLEAFEGLWAGGSDARLVIAGRAGWGSEALRERLRLHPERGRRLFVFEDLSDDELAQAYGRARAVVCASFAEGFGLPVVEALTRRVPVFASDIPSHVEVGGKHCIYFPRHSSEALGAAIASFEADGRPSDVQPPETFQWPDWWESTVELLDEALRLAAPPQQPRARAARAPRSIGECSGRT